MYHIRYCCHFSELQPLDFVQLLAPLNTPHTHIRRHSRCPSSFWSPWKCFIEEHFFILKVFMETVITMSLFEYIGCEFCTSAFTAIGRCSSRVKIVVIVQLMHVLLGSWRCSTWLHWCIGASSSWHDRRCARTGRWRWRSSLVRLRYWWTAWWTHDITSSGGG